MIKYIGSKRRLVPVLGDLFSRSGAATAVDLFTGTTRVAQEWKRRGAFVTAVDSARYSAVLGECYIGTDAGQVDRAGLGEVISHLQSLPGTDGYVTETFSRTARYFQEANARRIDAIRDAIEAGWADHPWRPILLTSLLLAADRVDSTTGLQMAYLKEWSPRSYQPLELRVPDLLGGSGAAYRGDAVELVDRLPPVDLAYLDPPYNHHRYVGNYHVWETLVAWDSPDHYGVACKRVDVRDPVTSSVFNRRREAPARPGPAGPSGPGRGGGDLRQRRRLGDPRRPGGHGRRAGRGRGADVRLEALRRRSDRHLQPDGEKSGTGGPNPQHGVSRRRRSGPGRGPPVRRLPGPPGSERGPIDAGQPVRSSRAPRSVEG